MDLIRRMTLFILLVLWSFHVLAQDDFCGLKNTSFKDGEKISFKVYYNMGRLWVGAGLASFTVKQEKLNGRDVFHVIGDGKTLKSYEWFYKVNDRYESWIDVETMLPAKFVRNVNEGGYRIHDNVLFNQSRGQVVSNKGIFNVPRCVQDVLSAIYYARNINYAKYKPGTKIPFSMFLDENVYNLHITYLGKERIKTKYGTFNTIKISPMLIEGTIFKGGDKMVIWVTDDNNHIPVRIDSPIVVGSIKVDLVGYENLRNPFTALIRLNKD